MDSDANAILVEDVACRLACNNRPSRAKNSDAISAVPLDRWDTEATGEAVGARFGGFVASWAEFDAGVFSISPSEAAFLDPAQRVLLQVGMIQNRCFHDIIMQGHTSLSKTFKKKQCNRDSIE